MASMMEPALGRETAIKEVARGCDLAGELQALLRLSLHGSDGSEMADVLCNEVVQSLNMALSVLKRSKELVTSQCLDTGTRSSSCLSNRGSKGCNEKAMIPAATDRNKSRGEMGSWTIETSSPDYDGYQWKKYGEKKIQGAKFPRSYYRCTYSDDQGCLAKKQVQLKDCNDPPMFEVTYSKQHTCKSKITIPALVVNFPPAEPCLLTFEPGTYGINQEKPKLSSFTSTKKNYGINQEEPKLPSLASTKQNYGINQEQPKISSFTSTKQACDGEMIGGHIESTSLSHPSSDITTVESLESDVLLSTYMFPSPSSIDMDSITYDPFRLDNDFDFDEETLFMASSI